MIIAQAAPRRGRTSELLRRLGRSRPSVAAARALAPAEPRAARAEYSRRLASLWERWTTIAMRESGARYDAELFTASFDQLIDSSGLREYLGDLGRKQDGQVRRYMQSIVRTPARPRGVEQMIEEFRDRNVALIKGLGADQAERLKTELRLASASNLRHEQLAEHVQRVLDVGASRARLIARDQVLKFNSSLQRVHQSAAGITRYVWLTVGDEAVRPDHRALHMRVFEWGRPPTIHGEPLNPGEDFQCRCQAVPQIDLFADLDEPTPPPVPAAPMPEPDPLRAPLPAKATPLRRVVSGVSEADLSFLREGYRAPLTIYEGVAPADVNAVATGKLAPPGSRSPVPPISIAVEADGQLVLIDGRHRLEAAQLAGAREIRAKLRVYGKRGAVLWEGERIIPLPRVDLRNPRAR